MPPAPPRNGNPDTRHSIPVGWALTSSTPPGYGGSRFSGRQRIQMAVVVCLACAFVLNVAGLMFGHHSPPPPPNSYDSQGDKIINAASELAVSNVVASAETLAGGPRITSFANVSLLDLQKANHAAHLQPGVVTGLGNISVDLCADTAACTSVEVAARANRNGTCWLARAKASLDAPVTTSYGWTSRSRNCTAGSPGDPTIPTSGWRATEPVWSG
jgi:hypothetical protein